MMSARLLALSVLAVAACRDAAGKQAEPAPRFTPAPAFAGSPEPSAPAALASLEQQTPSDYVPAEHKQGMARWKDVGVYLDGKPIGFLAFGELPVTLKPTWVKDKVSANKPASCPECPAWKWSQQRFYKFTDYLNAMGIPLARIKQLHVYGSKLSQTVVVTGRDLMTKRAEQFMFRFGGDVAGKALPWVPEGFGNGKTPDKIAGVMIYIDRTPPIVTREGIELDGVPMTGVPYYGEPLRGGVRIYLDDKLATIIKRQELDPKLATTGADGELQWELATFLKGQGVDASKLVEGWIIRDERRAEKIEWSQLASMKFSASSQAKGGVLLGAGKLRANAIALHTRPVADAELPVIADDEAW